MHPAAYYALSLGLKTERPIIYQKYQPIPYDKFIIINAKNNQYKYWQECIDLIFDELKANNIAIIQILEDENQALKKVSHFIDKKNFNINAYICKNTLLYVGEPSLEMHMCGIFDKKIVQIFNTTDGEEENLKPYWSKSKDIFTFKLQENPYPEDLAKKIFKFLDIKKQINFKTHYIGSEFIFKKVEVVPNDKFDLGPISKINNQIIRMDINFNELFLNEFLSIKKSIIFTDKPIDINILNNNINNIINIVYILGKNYSFNFIKEMKNLGITYTLISFAEESLIKEAKYELMDYGIINKKELTKQKFEPKQSSNYFFKSSRILYDGINFYSSEYHYINKIPQIKMEKIENNSKFWESIEDFYIFSID